MSRISYLSKTELSDFKDEFLPVKSLSSKEDVATFVEAFEEVRKCSLVNHIESVVESHSNHYIFIIDDHKEGSFDFYKVLNELYVGDDVIINCVNLGLMFPKTLSRGIYSECYSDTSDFDENDATEYMDSEDLEDALNAVPHYLLYGKLGAEIPITEQGIIIGRSAKKADYIIHDNKNISREHCRVYKKDSLYYVHDCNSNNGTYVNGLRVRENKDVVIPVGAVLMLADEEFKMM